MEGKSKNKNKHKTKQKTNKKKTTIITEMIRTNPHPIVAGDFIRGQVFLVNTVFFFLSFLLVNEQVFHTTNIFVFVSFFLSFLLCRPFSSHYQKTEKEKKKRNGDEKNEQKKKNRKEEEKKKTQRQRGLQESNNLPLLLLFADDVLSILRVRTDDNLQRFGECSDGPEADDVLKQTGCSAAATGLGRTCRLYVTCEKGLTPQKLHIVLCCLIKKR